MSRKHASANGNRAVRRNQHAAPTAPHCAALTAPLPSPQIDKDGTPVYIAPDGGRWIIDTKAMDTISDAGLSVLRFEFLSVADFFNDDNLLTSNTTRPDGLDDEQNVERIAQGMMAGNRMESIVVCERGNHGRRPLGGRHRLLGARKAGRLYVLAIILPDVPDHMAEQLSLRLNLRHGNQISYDALLNQICSFIGRNLTSKEKAATDYNVPKATITDRLRINALREQAQANNITIRCPDTHLRHLSKLKGDVRTEVLRAFDRRATVGTAQQVCELVEAVRSSTAPSEVIKDYIKTLDARTSRALTHSSGPTKLNRNCRCALTSLRKADHKAFLVHEVADFLGMVDELRAELLKLKALFEDAQALEG